MDNHSFDPFPDLDDDEFMSLLTRTGASGDVDTLPISVPTSQQYYGGREPQEGPSQSLVREHSPGNVNLDMLLPHGLEEGNGGKISLGSGDRLLATYVPSLSTAQNGARRTSLGSSSSFPAAQKFSLFPTNTFSLQEPYTRAFMPLHPHMPEKSSEPIVDQNIVDFNYMLEEPPDQMDNWFQSIGENGHGRSTSKRDIPADHWQTFAGHHHQQVEAEDASRHSWMMADLSSGSFGALDLAQPSYDACPDRSDQKHNEENSPHSIVPAMPNDVPWDARPFATPPTAYPSTSDTVQLKPSQASRRACASTTQIPQPQRKGRVNIVPASTEGNPRCRRCGKGYRITRSAGFCGRCGDAYERSIAMPRIYQLDSTVPTLAAAQEKIYPRVQARYIAEDDAAELAAQEGHWVELLLAAVNHVADDIGDYARKQQKTYNEKAKMEDGAGYSSDMVTARIRALYHEAVLFHLGEPAPFYAVGGDNGGYSENRRLIFSERMREIARVLETDKRVVMDVIEGRGVQGFVGNPSKYHERKSSNNNCNRKKKSIMDKGKNLEGSGENASKRKRDSGMEEIITPERDVGEVESSSSDDVDMENQAEEREPAPAADAGGQTYGCGRTRTVNWVRGCR